ncbi:hypothetical protein HOD75_02400 [archaeon]|nr:hypothetical protein [archaeon]MBT4241729.1 hypothetical protein [archaeon]MBT4418277.1 hypothetical protein [archaeon]
MVNRIFEDERGAKLVSNKLINIIILIFVLVMVLLLVLYWFFPNVLNDLIPDFMTNEGNETIDEDLCTKVAFIDKDGYFYIKGVKTNLYSTLRTNRIMYSAPWRGDIHIGNIESDGEERQVIIFDRYLGDFEEINEFEGIDEDKLPDLEILERFSESFRLGESSWLCEGERICKEKCEFFGECSERVDVDKVHIGRMDCEKGFCLVEKSKEILEDNGLEIKEFGFSNYEGGVDNLLDKDSFELTYGVESAKLIKFDIEGDDVCYVIRTNKRYLDKGSDDFDVVGWVAEGDDETLELSAWSLDGRSVVKRLEIKSKELPQGFAEGEVIRDKFFSGDIQGISVGERAYVFGVDIDMYDKEKKVGIAPNDFMIKKVGGNEVEILMYDKEKKVGIAPNDFMIKKVGGNEVEILMFGESGGFNVIDWKELDCLLWWRGIKLNLDKLKGEDYSLRKVLYEFCELN